MGVVSVRAFAAALRDLDQGSFERFVGDLLAARGYEVDPAGDGAIVASEAGDERVFFLYHPSRFRLRSSPPDQEVDVVVTSRLDGERARALAAEIDADLLDAADLYHLLLYALDRETASDLARTHLDTALSVPERGTERGSMASVRETLNALVGVGRRGAVVLAVVLVVVAATVFGTVVSDGFDTAGAVFSGGPSGVGGAGEVNDPGEGGPGATAEGLSVTPAPPAASPGPQLQPTNESLGALPPGLGESRIEDADALARAHEQALAGWSYRWVVTYEERVGGRSSGAVRETVAFQRVGVYSVGVERWGDPRTDPTLFALGPAYADGEYRYEPIRVTGGREDVRVMALPVVEDRSFRDRAATYIQWHLSVSRSAITDVVQRDGRTFYRVETVGDPYPGAENAQATALIDSRGMVHRLRTERDLADSDVNVVLTFRYTGVGNTTVQPPAWYGANGSTGTTTTAAAATNTTTTTTVAADADGGND